MNLTNYLWVEQARPQTISDLILPTAVKKSFQKYIEDKEIPHLLFESSSPGTGKTSAAKALCNDLDADSLYINASSENGIDTLRSKVIKFASSRGIYTNKAKIIILDEMDGTTEQFQKALRPVMEEFSKSCRFIITCNYQHKIIEAIHSRCQTFSFNASNKEASDDLKKKIVKRIRGILMVHDCTFDDDTVVKLVDAFYPDIRKTIGTLQQYANQNGNVIDESVFNFNVVGDDFYKFLIKKDGRSARKYIIDSGVDPSELYSTMYQEYLPHLELNEIRYAQSLIILNDYAYKNSFVIDKELNLAACIFELCAI